VQVDRLVVAGLAQQRDQPLAFAQRIDADKVAALGEEAQRMQQPADLALVGRMAKHRQAERRLGDEDIALLGLEQGASRVSPALVIARDDDPAAAIFEHHLGAAQHMAGRGERHSTPLTVAVSP